MRGGAELLVSEEILFVFELLELPHKDKLKIQNLSLYSLAPITPKPCFQAVLLLGFISIPVSVLLYFEIFPVHLYVFDVQTFQIKISLFLVLSISQNTFL